jgi:hypothetical protein
LQQSLPEINKPGFFLPDHKIINHHPLRRTLIQIVINDLKPSVYHSILLLISFFLIFVFYFLFITHSIFVNKYFFLSSPVIASFVLPFSFLNEKDMRSFSTIKKSFSLAGTSSLIAAPGTFNCQ